MTSHKETSAAKHRIQAFSEGSTPGAPCFIQIHFRVIFLVSSVSVFGKSTYSGSGQLLAAENRETGKAWACNTRRGKKKQTEPLRVLGQSQRLERWRECGIRVWTWPHFPPGNPVAEGVPWKLPIWGTQIIFQEQVKPMYYTVPPAEWLWHYPTWKKYIFYLTKTKVAVIPGTLFP